MSLPLSLGLLVLIHSPFSMAQVKHIALEIEGLHQANGSGDYDKIIAKAPGGKREVLPPGRAFGAFDAGDCKDCCISPANKDPNFYAYNTDKYIVSKPMSVAKIFIFTKPGTAPISDIAALKGKKVGLRAGLPFGNKIEKSGLDIEKSPSIVADIQKLEKDRIHAFFAYDPDYIEAFKSLGKEPFPFAKDKPVTVHEDRVLCKKSAATEKYVQELDKAIP